MKDANILKIGTIKLIMKGKIKDSYEDMYKKALQLAQQDYRREQLPKICTSPKRIWKKDNYLNKRREYHLRNMFELIRIKIKSTK